jgi:FkbM family methyltransferase
VRAASARVLYKVVTLFVGTKKRIIRRGGITYEVDLSEALDLSLFLFGNFQRHVVETKSAPLPADATVVDVGANFGLMTLWYARACPKGQVFAFEPTHYALGRLRRNLELNPELAARVEVTNGFVSGQSDTNPSLVAFSSWRLDSLCLGGGHPVHLGTAHSAEGVPAISLDDFCRQRQLQRLDLIKIDTDGHEAEVLRGASATIERYRPLVLFEVGQYLLDERGVDFAFFTDFLGRLGYSLFDALTDQPVTLENYRRYVPAKATTDLIAVPREKLGGAKPGPG